MNKRNGVVFATAISIFAVTPIARASDPSLVETAEKLVQQARLCSQTSAREFAKLKNELADTVAAAAFDKCVENWTLASDKTTDAHKIQFDPERARANPYYGSATVQINILNKDRYSIDKFREAEIRRLRVLIIEERIKSGTH